MTSNYNKLFVVAHPRSGTSWLTRMMRQHPDVLNALSESHTYELIYKPFISLSQWNFRKRLKCWKWVLNKYGLIPIFTGIQSNDIWRGIFWQYEIYKKANQVGLHYLVTYSELEQIVSEVRALPVDDLQRAKELIGRIFDKFFEKQGGTNKQFFLEKTPHHLRYVDVILRQFPEAKVVEIIRDGRDICVSYASLAKNQHWARRETKAIIRTWNSYIQLGDRFRADESLGDRIHLVRYEQLRTDTRNELEKVFEFAGLSYSDTLLDTIIEKTDIKNINNKGEGLQVRKGAIGEWRTCLSATDIALWKELAGDTLARLGYDTEGD